ncbi:MAG: hypothetical protein WBE77_05175, partial [Candidatus Cybelea sp.]
MSLALLSLVIACSRHANSLLPSPGARQRHFRPKDLSQNYAAVILGDKPTDTEYAFSAASGTLLWTAPLSSWGNVGTVIANGMVYV